MAAYMLAINNILDREAWDEYHAAMPALIIGQGVTPHSGGAYVEKIEGDPAFTCDYLGFLEFRDMDHLHSFLDSDAYKALVPLAARATRRTVFAFGELPIGQS